MFLNAVVLVLQEILEAALILSLLLAFVRYLNLASGERVLSRRNWVVTSIIAGVFLAWIFSNNFNRISNSFDYVGLEITNASIHSASCFLLVLFAWLFPVKRSVAHLNHRSLGLVFCMVVVVTLAILREGSEIMQFGGGILGQGQAGLPIFYGGVVGAGIGVSTGVLLYYALTGLSIENSLKACVLLLSLTAGNMASQAILLLNQADWLPFTPTAWDSSGLLSESSVLGQLAYALIGYEATPSIMQVSAYLLGLFFVIISPISRLAWSTWHDEASQI
jgi:high-affinity iron transporter